MIHDIIVSVGVYAVFQFEVSPATVTAFLTILGFSLYDTVVVFDKIGENQKTLTATGRMTYPEMVNRSLNAVLMRSLSTTIVALLPVISLLVVGSWIMGATSLESFALALAVGLGIGAYSSIFVASPILASVEGARAPVPGARRPAPALVARRGVGLDRRTGDRGQRRTATGCGPRRRRGPAGCRPHRGSPPAPAARPQATLTRAPEMRRGAPVR